jgi:AcrR family transcriptional regulator
MPRPKTLSDADVLDIAHRLIHELGPDALTFQRLASECGLATATLVQRFSNKPRLIQRALLFAWDQLDAQTAQATAAAPKTPDGAIQILLALTGQYGGIESYAQGLLVLREDVRDPLLRARGAAWHAALSSALEACFTSTPKTPRGIGSLLAAQWQGLLVWWSFDPRTHLAEFVDANLRRYLTALGISGTASP